MHPKPAGEAAGTRRSDFWKQLRRGGGAELGGVETGEIGWVETRGKTRGNSYRTELWGHWWWSWWKLMKFGETERNPWRLWTFWWISVWWINLCPGNGDGPVMSSGGTSLEGFVLRFFGDGRILTCSLLDISCWLKPPFDPSFPCICHWETLLIAVVFHPSLTVFFCYIPVVHGPLSINRHFLRRCHLCIGIMPKWSIVSFEGNSWP